MGNSRIESRKKNTLADVSTFEDLIKLLYKNRKVITLNTRELKQRANDTDISYSVNLIWQFIRTNPNYIKAYKYHLKEIKKITGRVDRPTDRNIKEKESADSNFGRDWYLKTAIDYKQITISPTQMLLEEPVVYCRQISADSLSHRSEFSRYGMFDFDKLENIKNRPLIIHINPLHSDTAITKNIIAHLKEVRENSNLEVIKKNSCTRESLITHLAIRHCTEVLKVKSDDRHKLLESYIKLVDDKDIVEFKADAAKRTKAFFKNSLSTIPWSILQYKAPKHSE